jgi:Fe-S-cluster containining protein
VIGSQFKSLNSDTLDQIFSNVHSDVFKTFNCLSCANCCKNYSPIIESDEINVLCTALNISAIELFENYVEMDEEGDFVFKSQPCPMLNLEDNKCTIYESRPRACREYPHTNMKAIKNHLELLKKNIEICPAAEEIVQRVIKQIEDVEA